MFLGPDFNSGSIKNKSFINLWKKSLNFIKIIWNDTCKSCNNYSKYRGGYRISNMEFERCLPLVPIKEKSKSRFITKGDCIYVFEIKLSK